MCACMRVRVCVRVRMYVRMRTHVRAHMESWSVERVPVCGPLLGARMCMAWGERTRGVVRCREERLCALHDRV